MGVVSSLFTHMPCRQDGRPSDRWVGELEKACLGCISETVKYRMLILGRDICWGLYICSCMM